MSIKKIISDNELEKLLRPSSKSFLWHLNSPWLEKFDHSHWWDESGVNVTVEAMVWELFRRHPDTRNFCFEIASEKPFPRNNLQLTLPPPQIAAWCCDSWPKLAERTRKLWRSYLTTIPPKRGIQAGGLVILNDYREELVALKHSPKGDVTKRLDLARGLMMVSTKQSRMTAEAIAQDTQGKILLAIDPLATGAGKQVERIVKAWRNGRKAVNRGKLQLKKSRNVIAKFEAQELSRKANEIRDDQLFAQYRRIIGRQAPDEISSD